ncbi:unnamed protein product [Protopolystoma xenopodis]|uniref:Uncharacterized protein n=1 Tax=Protopolystoma xenopodis TaxID=117903 RepID=A0A448WGZ1_9PLAT|nr:unnamed protein product [Protopolystoma xenopodis]
MVIRTDDAGEKSVNVPRPRSDLENANAYNGRRTRCLPPSLPTKMTKLRKQGPNRALPKGDHKLANNDTTKRRAFSKEGVRPIPHSKMM